ncbi:hypothetical protein B0T19DRAFT_193848 [Cercophora scortea]|uniref:Uncharacterized protein n=1 Tax=Cercophora scortea TaxID=314031 RepID=A0AAE0IP01_9PEZI|nr:hypothetical protein B0T19DRAFT_193848 [Cercophora scortea]
MGPWNFFLFFVFLVLWSPSLGGSLYCAILRRFSSIIALHGSLFYVYVCCVLCVDKEVKEIPLCVNVPMAGRGGSQWGIGGRVGGGCVRGREWLFCNSAFFCSYIYFFIYLFWLFRVCSRLHHTWGFATSIASIIFTLGLPALACALLSSAATSKDRARQTFRPLIL